MENFICWLDIYFHGTSAIWITSILCSLICILFIKFNVQWASKISLIAAGTLIGFAMGMGMINLSLASVCDDCGRPFPSGEAHTCGCAVMVAGHLQGLEETIWIQELEYIITP